MLVDIVCCFLGFGFEENCVMTTAPVALTVRRIFQRTFALILAPAAVVVSDLVGHDNDHETKDKREGHSKEMRMSVMHRSVQVTSMAVMTSMAKTPPPFQRKPRGLYRCANQLPAQCPYGDTLPFRRAMW